MLINNGSVSFEYIKLYSLSSKKIAIPIFQRFYDWKEKQMTETLNDITNSILHPEKEIYLLDFIFYEEDNIIKIADGQQRLVSLNIFIKCINDVIDEKNLKINKIKCFDISYDNTIYNEKYLKSFNNYMVAPFKKMYFILKDYLTLNLDQIDKIIYSITDKIYIYMKKTASSDDAFAIFTQINTGGKPLSKDEVIKTAIDQYADVYGISVGFSNKELKKGIIGYYKYINTANDNFDTIAIMGFLKNYIIKNKTSFKDFVEYLNLISKVSSYSISYIIEYINRSQLFDILNIMAMKKIDIKTKKEYLTLIMFPLCLLSIIMTIKKSNPGGIIRSLYSQVIDKIKQDKKPNEICALIASFANDYGDLCKIPFNDFKDALGKKELSTKIKESILIMDVVSRTTSSDLNVPSINLEHIYPQNPSYDWAMKGWPTSKDEEDELIHNIGNYLLLNEAVNKKIQNKYINSKVVEYNKIIPQDITLQTTINTVNFTDFETRKKSYIFDRQNEIAEYVYNNFILGNVLIKKE